MLTFTNEVTVNAPLDTVWETFDNVPLIAECVPGASVTGEREGRIYDGQMQVKVGPVSLTYQGTIEVTQRDENAHTITLAGRAKERGGSGNLQTELICALRSEGEGTQVTITSNVNVTGRVAQFGRGIMQSVGAALLKRFAGCLEEKLGG